MSFSINQTGTDPLLLALDLDSIQPEPLLIMPIIPPEAPKGSKKRGFSHISAEESDESKRLTIQMIRLIGDATGTKKTIHAQVNKFLSPEGEIHLQSLSEFQGLSDVHQKQILENRNLKANTLKNWERDERVGKKRVQISAHRMPRNQFIYETIEREQLENGKSRESVCNLLSDRFQHHPDSLIDHFPETDFEVIKTDGESLTPKKVNEGYKTYYRHAIKPKLVNKALGRPSAPDSDEIIKKRPRKETKALYDILKTVTKKGHDFRGKEFSDIFKRLSVKKISARDEFSGIEPELIDLAKKAQVTPHRINVYIKKNNLLPTSKRQRIPILIKQAYLEIWRCTQKAGYFLTYKKLYETLKRPLTEIQELLGVSKVLAEAIETAKKYPLKPASISFIVKDERNRQNTLDEALKHVQPEPQIELPISELYPLPVQAAFTVQSLAEAAAFPSQAATPMELNE